MDVSSFFISSLEQTRLIDSSSNRILSLDEYRLNVNYRSNLRKQLISSYMHNYTKSIHSLLLISSTFSQLTLNPNELQRSSLVNIPSN